MENTHTHKLYLYNDKKHSFLYVIACVINVCKHEPLQAEQCTILAHKNGKCCVKNGDYLEMLELKEKFEKLNLISEIESHESYMY